MPVHVAHPDGEAKFWIAPDLAIYVVFGFSPPSSRGRGYRSSYSE